MRRALLAAVVLLAGCGGGSTVKGPPPSAPERIHLASPAFAAGRDIPKRFTCDGANVSPPLRWSGVPRGAKELALLLEDPDAPGGTFVHWVVLRLRPSERSLPEGRVASGALEGRQSFGRKGYGGPCPPKGDAAHRYVFALYALDRRLELDGGAPPGKSVAAIRAAALARGTLRATYGR